MDDRRTTRPRSIDLDADLRVSVDGATSTIRTTGDELRVDFASIADCWRFWRRSRSLRRARLTEPARSMIADLRRGVHVRAAGCTIAVSDASAPADLRVRWAGVVRSLFSPSRR